jgi:UDP-glucose 4-epimerase
MIRPTGEGSPLVETALERSYGQALAVDIQALTIVRGDILDLPGLISAVRDNRVGRIIHLAAFLGEEVQRRPYSGVRLNLMGTANILEVARLEGVSRVVLASSGTVFLGSVTEGLQKIDETIQPNPLSIYAATKIGSEFLGRTYADRYGLAFVCVRYVGGLYGPTPVALKATRERAIQDMVRAAIKGVPAAIKWPYGPTEILYGKDAAKATVLAALKDKLQDRLFHIGNGQIVGGDEILEVLKKHFPESKIKLLKAEKPMPYPEASIASDFSRAREQLGYEPEYVLEQALLDYAATLKKVEEI